MANSALATLLRHVRSTADRAAECRLSDPDLLARFLTGRDEAAFATLVRRHGGLVLAACRRSLNDPADVEDAFQATLVVLLRKAETIRHQQSLAGWLYRVASRAAAQVRESRDCRRRHEARAACPEVTAPTGPDLSWRETSAILHAEVDRLPLRLSLPLILCYFDGKTRDEAAKQLGWSLGVLRGRLDRGRAMLRKRLARRGVELSAGLFAVLGVDAARAVTPTLLRTTIQAATSSVDGLCEAGSSVAGLCEAGLREASYSSVIAGRVLASMGASRAAIAAAVLALGLLVAGTGLLAPAGAPPDDKMPAPAIPASPAVGAMDANGFTVAGRVVDPDDKPVADAKLFVCDNHGRSPAPQPTTDADGRFRFSLPADFSGLRALLITSEGFGSDWENIRPNESADLTLRLPADVPIRGKVVDLEGKPVADASVQVVELSTSESGNLDEFLRRWAADREKSVVGATFRLLTAKSVWPRDGLKQMFATTTAADGTFRLTGIGRDRCVLLGVCGPGVANHYHRLLTRPDFRAAGGQGQVGISGPEPTIAVPPDKAIVGTVRDARTKRPLAGLRVIAYTPDQPLHWWYKAVETVTDAEGHYRLDGLTKARHVVVCDPGTGSVVYMHRFEDVGDTAGFAPVTQDVELLRGVVVSGQITDRSTGRPVRARVVYSPLLNNPHFASVPGYAAPRTGLSLWVDSREMITGPDGRFRLTALPGPGGLFVRAVAGMYAAPPLPTKEDREGGVYHENAETFFTIGQGDIFPLPDLHAYRIIRPAADATELAADFALEPGARRHGRLLDPEGKPLAGARFVGLNASPRRFRNQESLPGAEFTAEALNPAKPRRLFFWHEERKLAGTIVLRGDEPEPVTVTLRPLATLTGRAVAKNGEPLVGHFVEYSGWPELRLPHEDGKRGDENPIVTDADGRFRLTGLPAGVPLQLSIIVPKTRFATIHRDKIVLEPGQTKDLGDLRGSPMP
jgi:RNA polymerase sigma factor (sigma-70 family)